GHARRTPADPDQDEVWLRSGDQLLGKLLRADRRTLELEARFGTQSFPWGEVRGIYPRQEPAPQRTTDGEHVEVSLHPGAGPEPDRLAGLVRGLDDRRLLLRHAVLGDLEIPRPYLRKLRCVFH